MKPNFYTESVLLAEERGRGVNASLSDLRRQLQHLSHDLQDLQRQARHQPLCKSLGMEQRWRALARLTAWGEGTNTDSSGDGEGGARSSGECCLWMWSSAALGLCGKGARL